MSGLLRVSQLSYQYPGGAQALHRVSFSIAEGESVALLGPNGSGKTTLLLHLNGTLLGAGSVFLSNLEVKRETLPEVRKAVGIVFQEADEQLFMPTVLEDVMFGLLNQGVAEDNAEHLASESLIRVGIDYNLFQRPPFHLSAGEKRRVALAGILVMKPKLLVLDEPTTSLDPPGQRALVELLNALPEPKLVATHDAKFAAAIAQRAIFLDQGTIVDDGNVTNVIARHQWEI